MCVLDLTDPATRRDWGATIEELTDLDDYSRCHEMARLARRAGYEAIRYPSAVDGESNYAVFLDKLKPGSEVEIVNEDDLDEEVLTQL